MSPNPFTGTSPPRSRSRANAIALACCAVVFAALAIFGAPPMLRLLHNRALFPGVGAHFLLGPVPEGAQSIWLDRPGARVEAFWFPPPGTESGARHPAFLILHGNYMPIDHFVEIARIYQGLGMGVLLMEYRGYGRSTGAPDPEALHSDALAFYGWLAARPEVDARRIGLHGYSIGGALAGTILGERPVSHLVLVSTFTDLKAIAREKGAPGFLVRDIFRTLDAVQRFSGPVLVLHGGRDRLIPVRHGQALAAAARQGQIVIFPDADHSTVPIAGQRQAIARFLGRPLEPEPPSR